MNKKQIKSIQSSFILQNDSTDCGVACLLSLVNYYSGWNTLEKLRELAGTSVNGTTMLGLYQAANQIGLDALACEADIQSLIDHNQPVILHTVENNMQHYLVCYGYNENKFIIGDPAKGIDYISTDELNKIWISKACLTLKPNSEFKLKKNIHKNKLFWIKNLIREDVGVLIVCAFMGLIMSALGLTIAIFSQQLIDDILPSKNYKKLFIGLSLLAILLLSRVGMMVLRNIFLLRQEKNFNNRIVALFYQKILALDKLFFDSRKTGDFVARLNDTRRIQNVINQLLGERVIDFSILLSSLIFLAIYSWKILIISIIVIPIIYYTIYLKNNRIINSQNEVMKNYGISESFFINTIQGITTIKNFNKEDVFSKENQNVYGSYLNKIFDLGILKTKINCYVSIYTVLYIIFVLMLGSVMVISEEIKLGELMAILTICSSVIPSITNLSLTIIPINEAKVAFNRMFEFISLNPDKQENKISDLDNFESLQILNLAFRYSGQKRLINDISLHVNKGEVIGLIGESGCGKSTLCNIISKHYEHEDGNIIINGETNLNHIDPKYWRNNILGVALQEPYIFNGTILDNITMDNKIDSLESVMIYFERYNLNSYFKSFPQGYYTLIGESGKNLSGGQKQLISLARVLYKKPQLLILDEISSAWDKNTEKFIIDLLLTLKKEMGTIFISHKLNILPQLCDRIYVMDKTGRIVAAGSHSKLLEEGNNLYSEFWERR
jgi:ATP-binding cassette subfamily B protein